MSTISTATVLAPAPQVSPTELVDRLRAATMPAHAARTAKTPTVLARLASQHDDPEFLWFLVGNSHTPPETLAVMSHSRYKHVRCAVASHQNTSAGVLKQLASSKVLDVRLAVAANQALPDSVLALLVAAPDVKVRYELVCNPSVARALLPWPELDELTWDVVEEIGGKRSAYTPLGLSVFRLLVDHPDENIAFAARTALDDFGEDYDSEDSDEVELEDIEMLRATVGYYPLYNVLAEVLFLDELLEPVDAHVADIAEALAPTWEESLPALLSAASAVR